VNLLKLNRGKVDVLFVRLTTLVDFVANPLRRSHLSLCGCALNSLSVVPIEVSVDLSQERRGGAQ